MTDILESAAHAATVLGVAIGLVGLYFVYRQLRDATAARYIDFLMRQYQEYSSEDMLRAVRLVRETPLDRYAQILQAGDFTAPEWVARRKVSAYWQAMALFVHKRFIDRDTFFRLSQSTVTIFKKLHEIRKLPNPHFRVYDLEDVAWLYEEWKRWKEQPNPPMKRTGQTAAQVEPSPQSGCNGE